MTDGVEPIYKAPSFFRMDIIKQGFFLQDESSRFWFTSFDQVSCQLFN